VTEHPRAQRAAQRSERGERGGRAPRWTTNKNGAGQPAPFCVVFEECRRRSLADGAFHPILNSDCIFIARPMSPAILSLPLMKAIWPLSLPVVMSE